MRSRTLPRSARCRLRARGSRSSGNPPANGARTPTLPGRSVSKGCGKQARLRAGPPARARRGVTLELRAVPLPARPGQAHGALAPADERRAHDYCVCRWAAATTGSRPETFASPRAASARPRRSGNVALHELRRARRNLTTPGSGNGRSRSVTCRRSNGRSASLVRRRKGCPKRPPPIRHGDHRVRRRHGAVQRSVEDVVRSEVADARVMVVSRSTSSMNNASGSRRPRARPSSRPRRAWNTRRS